MMRFAYSLVVLFAVVLAIPCASQQTRQAVSPNIDIMPHRPRRADIEVLSDTGGVDFGLYLGDLTHSIVDKWRQHMPKSAQAPERKQGTCAVEFEITKGGRVSNVQLHESTGF